VTVALTDHVRDLLQRQSGVLTRAQALSHGMTRKQIEVQLGSGRWQRLHPGVYATFTGDPQRSARLWGAVLRAGDQAALSHQTAAGLHGLMVTPATAIHVMVPSGQLVAPIQGVALPYSCRVAEARHPVRTPPQTWVEETVLDLAGEAASLDEALGWIFRACGSRRTTAERIASAMARRARMRWRTELVAALGLGAGGVHSLLEFRYVSRVERPHGLPVGTRQLRVSRAGQHQYQDVTCQACGVVVELDGRVAHPVELRWRDIHRDNATTAAGQRTLRYGWADVSGQPCRVAAQVGGCCPGAAGTGGCAAADAPARFRPGRFPPDESPRPFHAAPSRVTGWTGDHWDRGGLGGHQPL
jgi:hypothetical protein